MRLENYYLFGLPIPLEKYNLGTIYQPRYLDLINKKMELSDFIRPFFLNELIHKKYSEMVKEVGEIVMLMVFDAQKQYKDHFEVIGTLIEVLKMVYQTDNIRFIEHSATFIIDNKIVIDKDNFNIFSKVIMEMTRSKFEIKEEEEDNEILDEFERRRLEYEKKTKKKNDGLSMLEIANVLVHSQDVIDYDKVLNLTIYQIKNSYEALQRKELNKIEITRQASMKFDIQEVGFWQTDLKIEESNLL